MPLTETDASDGVATCKNSVCNIRKYIEEHGKHLGCAVLNISTADILMTAFDQGVLTEELFNQDALEEIAEKFTDYLYDDWHHVMCEALNWYLENHCPARS